ncbi:hypothetical protein [Holdemania massiliensis]
MAAASAEAVGAALPAAALAALPAAAGKNILAQSNGEMIFLYKLQVKFLKTECLDHPFCRNGKTMNFQAEPVLFMNNLNKKKLWILDIKSVPQLFSFLIRFRITIESADSPPA